MIMMMMLKMGKISLFVCLINDLKDTQMICVDCW